MSPTSGCSSRGRWQIAASDAARCTINPIRALVESLELRPHPDKQLIALSIGDPTLYGHLKPPPEVLEAMKRSLESFKYNGYAASVGQQKAREAVAQYSSSEEVPVTYKDVVLCSGCSSALDMCITVLANPGQNILIPRPGFSIYRTLAETWGIRVKYYNLKPEKNWEVDLDDLEQQIDGGTAALIVTNPSNPCGSVFSRQHLADIVAIASRNFVPIIADEIYEHMVFPGHEFHPMASVSTDVPILSCSGLTKRFLVPGWRMGWIIIHDRHDVFGQEIRDGLQRLSQRTIGSNTLVQGALPEILSCTPQDFFDSTAEMLKDMAEMAYSLLVRVKGLTPVMPQGAMYMMVGIDMAAFPEFQSELDFITKMVSEESVFCLPGKCFDYPNYMRLVLAVPADLLREACERISQFCARHYQESTNVVNCAEGMCIVRHDSCTGRNP